MVGWRLGREGPRIGVTPKTGPEAERRCHVVSPAARRRPDSQSSRWSAFRIKLRSVITTGVMARSRERLLPLCDASATASTVQCQHEKDIVDPPSIIELFQEHPSDIPLVDTVEAIRMQEAVALLIRPSRHVVALT
jgi:hypothetical protein